MTFRVIAEVEARREWHEAVEWYEDRRPGVGLRFDDDLRAFLQSLARDPQRFRLFTRRVHKAKVPPPWPHSVYFTINTTHYEVKVLAIWHGARNPAQLRHRLK